MNSFSPFGWMGGCVLDGLLELHKNGSQAALQTQAYRNWGRGVAWYLLGMVKTLRALEDIDIDHPSFETMQTTFTEIIRWVSTLQNEEGLWYGYIDRPETGIGTSTTGGIASAIAWGCHMGLLPASYQEISKKQRAIELPYSRWLSHPCVPDQPGRRGAPDQWLPGHHPVWHGLAGTTQSSTGG